MLVSKMGLLPAVLFISILSCGSVDSETDGELRVLFIGNSLTYTNDMPAIVAALSRREAGTSIETRTVALPNFSLEDHWHEGSARVALEEDERDIVVMQQGPSSLPENQENLREWSENWADVIREEGAQPALFTVWPSGSRSFAFPAVVESYANAAAAIAGILLPAGSAWLAAWEENPELQLYGPDNFHPSQLGSYAAAAVIFGGLTDSSVDDLPASLRIDDDTVLAFSEAEVRVVARAADKVLSKD